jgi:hypothetical protein
MPSPFTCEGATVRAARRARADAAVDVEVLHGDVALLGLVDPRLRHAPPGNRAAHTAFANIKDEGNIFE